MEKESINEERNDEVEKNQFFTFFNESFDAFFKILDFNELDVNRYLSFKDSKKYKFYIMNRILTLMINYSFVAIPAIVGTVYPSLFGNLFLTTFIILGIMFIPAVISIAIIQRFFDKNYDYSMSIYRKEKKKMNKYCKQLNLIIYNRYVIEELGEINYTNNYKSKIKRINNRVDFYSKLFKPLNHYIIQFGLISLVFSFSPIVIDIINSFIQNQIISTDTIGNGIVLTLSFLSLFWLSYDSINSSIVDDLYDKRKILIKAKSSLSGKLKKATKKLEDKEFGKTIREKLFNLISNLMRIIQPPKFKIKVKKQAKKFKRKIKELKSFGSEELLRLQCSYDHDARRFILFEKYLVSSAGIEILGESKNIVNDEKAVSKIRNDLKKLI